MNCPILLAFACGGVLAPSATTVAPAPIENQAVAASTINVANSPAVDFDLWMIDVRAGDFICGNARGFWDEKPAHPVKLSHDFRIAARPVSNAQFEQFDASHRRFRGPGKAEAGDTSPVRSVTYDEANAFCRWLSHREGKNYRLPTEAEWEFAFRNHPAKLRNGRDVESWCLDWYGPYASSAQTDPIGYRTGEMRVVRGGWWRAKTDTRRSPNPTARLGALPDDRNPAIGIRVVEAPPIVTQGFTDNRPTPQWAKNVSQTHFDWKPRVDMTRPYFAEPIPYVKIPSGSTGPLFSRHNHVPSIVACPNGDLLAVWYSTTEEAGRELVIAAARLRQGHDRWDAASLFWDVPGRNDHASALWVDSQGTIFHFNGLASRGGWNNLALLMRTSHDNGRSWSKARFLSPTYGWGNMPIASVFQAHNGTIYLPCDAQPGPKGGSVLHFSHDEGQTWSQINKGAPHPAFVDGKKGATIAGIHTGVDEWTDGSLVAVGRGDTIDGQLAMSVSRDGGHSWTYSATPFPKVGAGQRPVLRRLREGALLLVSFTPGSTFTDTHGQPFSGMGLFAALSYDGGKTWPVKKLLTDGKARTLNGRGATGMFKMSATIAEPKGYLAAIQSPDGMIQLISSGIHYRFNVEWLKHPNTLPRP